MDHGEVESPNLNRSRILHRFFELGILIKGIDGGLELVGGLLLHFLSPAAISGIVNFLVRGELQEDPTDLISNLLLHNTRNVIDFRVPTSVFLIVHGVTKLLLVRGLAANKLWSYPAAIAVFAAFTVYQLYQLAHRYSMFLGIVTVLDIVVILLVTEEFRQMRMARRGVAV
jgi:uncharacterized membrane protein